MRQSYTEILLTEPATETMTVIGAAPATAVDKNYEQTFTNLAVVNVNHDLGKRPSVFAVDSAGDEVEGKVNHIDNANLVVTFTANFTGTIICN